MQESNNITTNTINQHCHITIGETQQDMINKEIYDILWLIQHFEENSILKYHIELRIEKLKDLIKPIRNCLDCGKPV